MLCSVDQSRTRLLNPMTRSTTRASIESLIKGQGRTPKPSHLNPNFPTEPAEIAVKAGNHCVTQQSDTID